MSLTPQSSLVQIANLKMRLAAAEEAYEGDYSVDEDRANLSIVRFAREVNSRRISSDYGQLRKSDRLDITNFPSGPLNSSNEPLPPDGSHKEEKNLSNGLSGAGSEETEPLNKGR